MDNRSGIVFVIAIVAAAFTLCFIGVQCVNIHKVVYATTQPTGPTLFMLTK